MPSKYHNIKVTLDGHTFDSKKEAKRYSELKLLERAGEIEHLQLQPTFLFSIGDQFAKYPSGRRVTYRADFYYFENGKQIVEDVKGYMTGEFKLKWAMMKLINGIEVRLT